MSTIQNIFPRLNSLFFPKQVHSSKLDVSEIALENLKKNYVCERSKAFAINSAFYLSGTATVGCVIKSGLFSTATLVSLLVTGILAYAWTKWTTRPYDLALLAYQAMVDGKEKEALKAIEAGANIYQDFSHLSLKSAISPNLFMQAIEYDCKKVIKCLMSLGWNLNQDARALGHASHVETVQLLVEFGAKVNLYDGRIFSPLWIQLSGLHCLHLDQTSSDLQLLDKYERKCQILDFLIEKGAKLQENPPRFNEKKRARDRFEETLKNVDAISNNDVERKTKIKNWIQEIYQKL